MTEQWGRMLNKWHDEVGSLHLLKPDGSPACGTRYFASGGAYPEDEAKTAPKCRRCGAIYAKRLLARRLAEREET